MNHLARMSEFHSISDTIFLDVSAERRVDFIPRPAALELKQDL
jgi:hypothetical protein